MRAVVVGSGPAGVACAHALVTRGVEVVLVDGGLTLEADRRATVAQLRATPQAQWPADVLARIKEGMEPTAGGVAVKHQFGSDFPYRGVAEHLGFTAENALLQPSLATGGFIPVWGAAVMPYAADEFDGWPINREDLAAHYRAVLDFMPLAGVEDDLAGEFPLYSDRAATLPLSPQAARLQPRLAAARARLRAAGITAGRARLAVRGDCVQCGLCLYGCPYGCIYDTTVTIGELRSTGGLVHEAGIVVDAVEESESGVRLRGHHTQTGEAWSMEADRVFLAAGVVSSARLLLAAQGGGTVRVLDSAYFLFPLLSTFSTPEVRHAPAHTLSQFYLELLDRAVSSRRVQVQLYTYSDLLTEALRHTLGPLAMDWLLRWIERHAFIAQAYLHSDESHTMELSVKDGRAHLVGRENPHTREVVGRVLRRLREIAPAIGLWPVPGTVKIMPPGRSFHCGGTWPMRAEPRAGESDVLGRPHGWSRVHVVDASVLPAIPATTITFSVMANAHRIGTLAPL
jgi:choline dehydrogenase-like flavoprotein